MIKNVSTKFNLGPVLNNAKAFMYLSHRPDFNMRNERLMPNSVAYKLVHFDISTENDKFGLKKPLT